MDASEVFAMYTKTEDFNKDFVINELTSEHDVHRDSEILKILRLVWKFLFLPEAPAKSWAGASASLLSAWNS